MTPNRGYTIADREREYVLGPTTAYMRQEIRVWDAATATWINTGKYHLAAAKLTDVLKF